MTNYEPIDEPAQILLVDDDEDDIMLITRAFSKVWDSYQIHTAHDGDEALAFLQRQGEYANAPKPDLILLDLNMPRINGYEVLSFVKGNENLKRIPVVVLTTASDEKSIDEAYARHANSFISKPSLYSELDKIVELVARYWLGTAQKP